MTECRINFPANAVFDKWSKHGTRRVADMPRVPIPLPVLIEEAVDVARFFQAYYTPELDQRGRVLRPGLEQAHHGGQFRQELGQEILELQEAVQQAHVRYLFLRPIHEVPVERAELVLRELQAGIGYLLDDGVEDEDDERLERVKRASRASKSVSALASALQLHAAFAEMHRKRLKKIGAFDVALIDEAMVLSKEMPLKAVERKFQRTKPHHKALQTRNHLAAMLYERMQLVRAAARFVFRNDRALTRRVTSSYLRDRVARYRKKEKKRRTEEDSGG